MQFNTVLTALVFLSYVVVVYLIGLHHGYSRARKRLNRGKRL